MNPEFSSKHFTLKKVRDGVYATIAKEGSGSVANAGFVDLGDQVIIFDTFNTQQASDDLRYCAEKIINRPVTLVVNSHWHGDHIRGNQTFKDCAIISSQMTFSKMKDIHPKRINKQKKDIRGISAYRQSLENQLHQSDGDKLKHQINSLIELEQSLPTLELVLPNQLYYKEITFYGPKRSAKLFTFGGGHSQCDSVLYLPSDKVAFMGDLLFVNCHPTFFQESNPEKWIEILKKIERMDIEVAVPGHGSLGTKKDILTLMNYISHLISKTRKDNNKEEVVMPTIYNEWTSPEIYQENSKIIKEWLILNSKQ
ncbi:MBL fold metallo-hydrolase [Bacillus spongiae]|uniref:MBL fold metallo-hydrolase n=1 Tax=Bacillus spongiae TaxID=2683610 RepID=A0ABU8HE21_9BACI